MFPPSQSPTPPTEGGAPPSTDPSQLEQSAVDDAKLLAELEKDFKRLKLQKSRKGGGIEGRILLNLAFVGGEQHVSYKNQGLYADPAPVGNNVQLTFNLIAPRMFKLIGRIASISIPYKARPDKNDPKALEDAQVVDRLIQALDEKLNQTARTWEMIWWMAVAGTVFVHTPWIPNVTMELTPDRDPGTGELMFKFVGGNDFDPPQIVPESQRDMAIQQGIPQESFEISESLQSVGDVGCEIFSPLQVFMDQSVRDVPSLGPDQWVHIAEIKTCGWISDTFGVEISGDESIEIVTSKFHQLGEAVGGMFLKDMIPLIQGTKSDSDPDMCVFVKSYAPTSKTNPKGKYVCWVPGRQILHNEGNPYEEIPLVDLHWKPVVTSLWTGDYVSDLIAPQRFINKRISQMGEQANNALYTPMLLAPGLKAEDVPADYPGVVENGLDESGGPRVGRMLPPELPNWFMLSIDKVMAMFNDVAGGADLFADNKFPGQLRGPMAVPMLQEILDTAWGPLYQHIGERMGRIQQQRLNRVKQFYPAQRTLHYTDRTQKDEVINFHTEEILRAGTNYNISIERGALVPELRALREARIRERLESPLGILYMDERTGRLDKSKIAADLEFGDTSRESKESAQRKFALEIIEMLWQGKVVPPPMPFFDHPAMMDELEAAMTTTEFLRASPPIQQAFLGRWNAHQQFMQQEASAQQNALQSGMIQGAVAQATQQAAAKAASMAVDSALSQVQAQGNTNPSPEDLVRSEMDQHQQGARPNASLPPGGQERSAVPVRPRGR